MLPFSPPIAPPSIKANNLNLKIKHVFWLFWHVYCVYPTCIKTNKMSGTNQCLAPMIGGE
jgi:hypothetical protein